MFYRGDCSWKGGGALPQKSFKPSQDLLEAHISPAVSEIFRY